MASLNTSWMPAQGRHRVEIGSSLARSLKSRKLNGEAPPPANKRSHLPDKDFYSFRYNHKPPSVDLKKPGMIEFRKKDASSTTSVILEQPSVQAGESAMFRGQEAALNKLDCVLIYDEDTGTFTLEKLDACIQLTSDRSLQSIIPVGASPTPSTSTPLGGNTTQNSSVRDATIDQDILDLVDDDITAPAKPKKSAVHKKEEEEEEEEEDDFPKPNRSLSPPPPKPPVQKPVPRSVKPMPKPRSKPIPSAAAPVAAPVALTPSKPPPTAAPPAEVPPRPRAIIGSSKGKHNQPRAVNVPPPVVEAVVSDSKTVPAKPVRPAKPVKQAPVPPPQPPLPPPTALALPGSFSAQTTLPSSMPSNRSGGGVNGKPKAVVEAPPVDPEAAPELVLSDSDESDWYEVATSNAAGAAAGPAAAAAAEEEELAMLEEDIFGGENGLEEVIGDGGEDDDFQRQLEMEMANMQEEDEDEDEEDIEMEPAEIPEVDGPISLNAFLGGGGMNDLSDDEYTSSEEEDD